MLDIPPEEIVVLKPGRAHVNVLRREPLKQTCRTFSKRLSREQVLRLAWNGPLMGQEPSTAQNLSQAGDVSSGKISVRELLNRCT